MKKGTKKAIIIMAAVSMLLSSASCSLFVKNKETRMPEESSGVSSAQSTESSVNESSINESSKEKSNAESSTVESAKESSESTKFSLKEFFESSEMQEQIKDFRDAYSTDEYTADIKCDDESIIFEMKYKEQIEITDSQKSIVEELVNKQIAEKNLSAGMFGNYDIKLIIRCLNADGSVIFEKVISDGSEGSQSSETLVSATGKYATLEEYINNPDVKKQLDNAMSVGSNEYGKMNITVEDGSKIVYVFTMNDTIEINDSTKSVLENGLTAYESYMKLFISQIKNNVEQEDISVIIRYCDQNGNTVVEREFTDN